MSKRTVVWDKSAETELGNIWFASGQSERITEASYEIDRDLRDDAERHGSPLAEGLFVIERPPSRAAFVISAEDMLVRVVSLSIVRV